VFSNILNPNSLRSGLSLSKILFGVSRSLQIAKNIVPIYQQISPLVRKVPSIINGFTNMKNNIANIQNKSVVNGAKKTILPTISNTFGPKFFL